MGGYADKFVDYKIDVVYTQNVLDNFPKEKVNALTECIADDPRPSYQNDGLREYGIAFAGYNIKFTVSDGVATVFSIEK